MTDTKPTLEEQILQAQRNVKSAAFYESNLDVEKAILASLKELAETKRLVSAANSFIELAFIAHPNLDLDIDAAIKEQKHD